MLPPQVDDGSPGATMAATRNAQVVSAMAAYPSTQYLMANGMPNYWY
jgi:hypothetical protein